MLKSQRIAAFVTGLTVIGALLLVVERGGLIAWTALFVGIALLAKIWFRPSNRDFGFGVGLAIVASLLWIGTHQYVIRTWESGEVVALTMLTEKGEHTARLWVLDIGSVPHVYYDAPPAAAKALLQGTPVSFERGGVVSPAVPQATLVSELTHAESELVQQTMEDKYGDRNSAAIVYYALLGSPRDRQPLIAQLVEVPATR